MPDPIEVEIDGVKTTVVPATEFNALNERFTAQQSELTKLQQSAKEPAVKEPTKEPAPNPLSLEPKEPAKTAPKADLDALRNEYAKAGELTDVQKKTLTDAGYDVAAVEYNFKTDLTKAADEITQIQNSIGGEEAFNSLKEWMARTLDDTQKGAYEAILATGNVHAIMSHLNTLSLQKNAADGTPPAKQIGGDNKSLPSQDKSGYTTQAEAVAARQDPKYREDPAYRRLVDTKLFHTDKAILGWMS